MWIEYRRRFVADDGRVVDIDNGGVSHSESQGYGLLLAAAAGDWACFDRILAWTARLARPDLPLFAWRWDPARGRPDDPNNATDGDVLIAWALCRAGGARGRRDLIERARVISFAIRAHLTLAIAGRRALLPGLAGFVRTGWATLNLSYYVFPAFTDFAELEGANGWRRIARDGQALARAARFGPRRLPPDWLDLATDGRMKPAGFRPARFGFDAVRLPLHLAWAGMTAPADLDVYRAAWRAAGDAAAIPPAWLGLADDGHAPYAASAGVLAVRDLAEGRRPDAATLWSAVRREGYYGASLALLALLAVEERGLR